MTTCILREPCFKQFLAGSVLPPNDNKTASWLRGFESHLPSTHHFKIYPRVLFSSELSRRRILRPYFTDTSITGTRVTGDDVDFEFISKGALYESNKQIIRTNSL